jgi:hypothetical protein
MKFDVSEVPEGGRQIIAVGEVEDGRIDCA